MSNERKSKPTDSLEFYIGLFLLAAGLFFILTKARVSSFGFYSFNIGGTTISSGLIVIPLILGVIWMFYNPKSIVARILSILGGIFIIAAIIVSVRITFPATSLFDYIIMIVLMASGAGMLLKAFFNKKKEQ